MFSTLYEHFVTDRTDGHISVSVALFTSPMAFHSIAIFDFSIRLRARPVFLSAKQITEVSRRSYSSCDSPLHLSEVALARLKWSRGFLFV